MIFRYLQLLKKITLLILVPFLLNGCSYISDFKDTDNSSYKKNTSAVSKHTSNTSKNWLDRTDIAIHGTQNGRPTYSIETVQPLTETEDTKRNTTFFQGRLATRGSDETLNLGLGYRRLLQDESMILGINTFFDTTRKNSHERIGLGLEAIGQQYTFRSNVYRKLSNEKTVINGSNTTYEQALHGVDYEIDTSVPYLPWMRMAINGYNWKAVNNADDLNGKKLTFSGYLSSNVIVDIGVNDDNYNGTDGFVKFTYLLGNNNINQNFTAEKVSANFSTDRNLKNHTLDKVKRQNDIIIQKRGGVVIGRSD